MASAIFTSLAQLGSQVGTASNEAREEKQAQAEKTQKMDVEQAYLQLARQAEDRQQAEFQQRIKTGDILELDPGKTWWSISQGKAINPPQPDSMEAVKKLISRYSKDVQDDVNDRIPVLARTFGQNTPKFTDAILRELDAARKGKNGPLIVDGKPAGVIREGQALTPASPEWTKGDQTQLDSYLKTYKESEDVKNARIKLGAESRIEAYMKTRQYGALDAQTGSLVYVNPDQMAKNPGRYAPPGPAIQAKNRNAIFQEIDTTKGFLRQALAKLPDTAFDAEARAQIAYVLKDDDPRSAWQTFKQSSVATTLTPEQIDYVTALVSLNESAMSLRSLAGMGSGSDMLRGAIQKMLPGANTPSRDYAMRQLRLFEGEVNALKTSVPNIGEPGQGGGATQGAPGQPPPGATIIRWEDVK